MIIYLFRPLAGCNGGGGRTRPRSTFHHVSRLSFAAFVYLSRPRWRVYYSVFIFQRATRLRSPRLQGWSFLVFPRPFSLSCLFCRVDYLRRVCVFHFVTTCVCHPLS